MQRTWLVKFSKVEINQSLEPITSSGNIRIGSLIPFWEAPKDYSHLKLLSFKKKLKEFVIINTRL